MPVVHLRDTVALLGRFPALAGVDLDVDHGEVVALRGPNGAGKTTLLRLCAGLVSPTAGSATVLGHDLFADRRSVRRRVGLIGHLSGLYADLSVAENVRFWASLVGADDGEAAAALDRLGLDPRLHDVATARLSTGQLKRTALAAMVVRRPELWLLDEPHAGLDQDARDLLDDLLREAVGLGATAVVASHELERAAKLADRSVHLAGGHVA